MRLIGEAGIASQTSVCGDDILFRPPRLAVSQRRVGETAADIQRRWHSPCFHKHKTILLDIPESWQS